MCFSFLKELFPNTIMSVGADKIANAKRRKKMKYYTKTKIYSLIERSPPRNKNYLANNIARSWGTNVKTTTIS